MTPIQWGRLEAIAIAATEVAPEERSAFLDAACDGDQELRRDVESLLEYEQAAEHFLQRPALQEAARTLAVEGSLDSTPPQIPGYDIAELLGVGGMGEVYRARDVRLARDVAIKVVHFAERGEFVDRFEEEARAASSLNHPNIVTIHAVGDLEAVAFIVMELVRGRTLRALLNDGPMTVAAVVDIATQLADGLAAAHGAGIVHRDLKPENIMVTANGLVKILDFGIAKREGGLSILTSSRSGTAGYMSPEQAAGRVVDYRSDQFSLGAVLYELLSGGGAFDRPTKDQTVAAIINAQPEPIREHGIHQIGLAQLIARCLEKDPDRRYSSTVDLAARLRTIGDELPTKRERDLSRRRVIALAAATLVGAAGVSAWMWRTAPIRRLAVLPFANPTADEGAEYLCDGLADSLIRRLSLIDGLEVKALAAVLHFKRTSIEPREIARQLNADAVLTGSLTRRGGRLIVAAELMDVALASRLWGRVFDRPDTDVLAVHDAIAAAIISDGLGITAKNREERQFTRSLTVNPRAYDLYLQAVHHFRLEQEEGYLDARDLLRRAIALDGQFVLALVSIASTYSVMAIDGYEAPTLAWPQSTANITRALELDPDLPDAHAEASAAAFYNRWDWASADREWTIALRSRRGEVQPELLTSRALQSWALGRTKDALQFARAARLADPLSAACILREADVLSTMGQFDPAVALYEMAIRNTPDDPRAYFGLADLRRRQRRFDEAIEARRQAGEIVGDKGTYTDLHGQSGYERLELADTRHQLQELRVRASTGAYVSPLDYARIHARLGDPGRAFEFLDASFEARAAGLVFLRVDPSWDKIRGDPRFRNAVRQVGLPAAT